MPGLQPVILTGGPVAPESRHHRRMPDGSLRDTVVFSITDAEWPAVRSGLRHRLARHAG